MLQREYGEMLVAPEDGFDATVQVDLSNIPEDWEEMVKKCGRLKRNCFASVFEKYFEFQVCPGGFLETSRIIVSIFPRSVEKRASHRPSFTIVMTRQCMWRPRLTESP